MRFIYNLLWPLGLLLFLPGYIVKMIRRGGYREKFGQRLGWFDVDLRTRLATQRSTWLHAVSVGESAVALKLAAQLRALEPNLQCVLTVTTTTGFAFASQNAPDWIEVMYTPLDFWPIMRRAFNVIRPARIILIEAEIWPNLVARAHAQKIPVALVNARLSPRSERRFRQFHFAVAPIFRLLDLVCVQEPDDIERWAALGVDRARIRHVGSIKYDPEDVHVDLAKAQAILAELKIDKNRPVILGGSTHAGEEEILGKIFRNLRDEFRDLFLIIAPRHAERAGEVLRNLERLNLRVEQRSMCSSSGGGADCLILDTTGELQSWYLAATVVFVGKSLTARGGQNPVEPILAGKPVVFGPHMENFALLARSLVSANGAIQVGSSDDLQGVIADLLRNSASRAAIVRNAHRVVEAHRGATARTAKLLVELVRA
ncbi:MAG: 3-deoxy-D-manno-octulosonic-acid transferase [Verrucomicrobiota bacterium]|jgi:3-deoxy-D-manno-octulosonic-acid transferase